MAIIMIKSHCMIVPNIRPFFGKLTRFLGRKIPQRGMAVYSKDFVWARLLAYLEKKLTTDVVSAWMDDAELVEVTDKRVIVYTPTAFRRDFLVQRCVEPMREALAEMFGTQPEVMILCEGELDALRSGETSTAFIGCNPQFTFDNFIVGPSNRFAHAAALAVANKPADSYNPLFIYGPSGLGKTHLLYAIASQIHRTYPDYNIVYIKGDQFTNELIEALKKGQNVEFRNKYRNADLFLVDDIQFIAGKESTQEEFFHTFNTLWENHRQIVLTADRPPKEMLKLEDRLKTRFEWGLLADITPPDYETRMAIIKNKCDSIGLSMPDDVCAYIAENITTNIRQIEGTVKKLKAYHDLSLLVMDVPHVARCIRDMHKGETESIPTPTIIITEVCRYYSIEEQVLRGSLKNKSTVEARQIAMYLIRKMTNLSLPDIGREFGRDHATVIHSLKKIDAAMMDRRSGVSDTVRDITANINSRL